MLYGAIYYDFFLSTTILLDSHIPSHFFTKIDFLIFTEDGFSFMIHPFLSKISKLL